MRLICALTLVPVLACATPQEDVSRTTSVNRAPGPTEPFAKREPAAPTPWTDAFLGSAILMADSILVEGPPGLFEHAVARADDELFLRKVKTTEEGFLQTVRHRTGTPQLEVVRGQLDAWQLAAFREVVFLERFDPAAPIRVTARGDAVWRDTNGNVEREMTLVFEGNLAPTTQAAAEEPTAATEAMAPKQALDAVPQLPSQEPSAAGVTDLDGDG